MKKVAIITGGNSGLGYSLCEQFKDTMMVISLARHNGPAIDNVQQIVCDVSDWEQVEKTISAIIKEYGRIDLIINAAAHFSGKTLIDESPKDLKQSYMTNVLGPLFVAKAALPTMLAQEEQSDIIMINSTNGLSIKASRTAYTGSKWGLTGATRVLGEELKGTRVHLGAIYQGKMENSMASDGIEYARIGDAIKLMIEHDRVGNLSEIKIEQW